MNFSVFYVSPSNSSKITPLVSGHFPNATKGGHGAHRACAQQSCFISHIV